MKCFAVMPKPKLKYNFLRQFYVFERNSYSIDQFSIELINIQYKAVILQYK